MGMFAGVGCIESVFGIGTQNLELQRLNLGD